MAERFRITPRAKADLHGIWDYTFETWGEHQADAYVSALYQRFGFLADQPRLGKHRADIKGGYYCFPQGEHLVFYIICDDRIDIIGVPRKDMNILNYF